MALSRESSQGLGDCSQLESDRAGHPWHGPHVAVAVVAGSRDLDWDCQPEQLTWLPPHGGLGVVSVPNW